MGQVIIGMDPHKRSATIEVINDREKVLAQGRFGTDHAGYQTMLKIGQQHKDRIWAVGGCNGIGRHIAQAAGRRRRDRGGRTREAVRPGTGVRHRSRRKTDPVDAHSVAVAALRSKGLRQVVVDDATVALRLLVDRDQAGLSLR
jgi:transposase